MFSSAHDNKADRFTIFELAHAFFMCCGLAHMFVPGEIARPNGDAIARICELERGAGALRGVCGEGIRRTRPDE